MTEFNFDMSFESLEGNLEGFLGGGELGQEINDIINALGELQDLRQDCTGTLSGGLTLVCNAHVTV